MKRILSCLCIALASSAAAAQQTTEGTGRGGQNFGGPDAVPNQIESDIQQSTLNRAMNRYDEWKAGLQKDLGLSLGIDYTGVYFRANEAFDDNRTGSGILRFYGSWDLVGRETGNTGSFIFKLENRHGYTDTAPSAYGLDELGYVGLVAAPYNDNGTQLTNLYWRQRFQGGRMAMMAGWIDVTDFLDLYGMASPWLHFTNLAFSTGNAAIALPNSGSLGAAFGAMLNKNMYFMASWVDANADPEKPLDGVDNFFGEREYFTSMELGWTSGRDRIYLENTHLTVWHKDRQSDIDSPSGWGLSFSFSEYVSDVWLPFIRGGYTRDAGSLIDRTIGGGMGFQLRPGKDLLGVGFNWGRPNEDTFGESLDNQYTSEVFYRFALGRRLALTADVQHLRNPALNPTEDAIWMIGARARVAF